MNIIRHYVESLFERVPENIERNRLKEEMIADMEEKYYEFLDEGASHNEALGKVISEFGDIDEIIDEMNLDPEGLSDNEKSEEDIEHERLMQELYRPGDSEIFEYLTALRKAGSGLATGVSTILIGVSIYMFLLGLLGDVNNLAHVFGISIILLAVAFGVGIIIYNGMKMSKYSAFDDFFIMDLTMRKEIKHLKENYRKSYSLSLIIGVGLCIIAVLPVIIVGLLFQNSESSIFFSISVLLLMISIATYLFIYSGNVWSSFNTILKNGKPISAISDISKVKRNNKIYHFIENVYWPLIVLVYLIWSFTGMAWAYSWIIFVAAGILEDFILGIIIPDYHDEEY